MNFKYKGRIITASSKKEAIKIIASNSDYNSFKKEFDSYWKPKYDEFYKVVNSCEFVGGSMWLTDCDSDFDKFAKFAFDEGFSVKNCPINYDYWIKGADDGRNEESIKKVHFGEIVLADDSYDNMFWRWEMNNDYKKAIANIKQLELACKKYF